MASQVETESLHRNEGSYFDPFGSCWTERRARGGVKQVRATSCRRAHYGGFESLESNDRNRTRAGECREHRLREKNRASHPGATHAKLTGRQPRLEEDTASNRIEGADMRLFVNFSPGIGDAVLMHPILAALGCNGHMFHQVASAWVEDPIFTRVKPPQFQGAFPSRWRFFHADDWTDIADYLRLNRIDEIINARADTDFTRPNLRGFVRHVRPDVLYLDAVQRLDARACPPVPVYRVVEKAVRDAGLIRCDVRYAIEGLVADNTSRHGTVLLPMAGEPFKVWPVEHWVSLAKHLPPSYWPVSVLSGKSDVEGARAAALAASLKVAGVPSALLTPKTLNEASLYLSQHRHAFGCDTGPLHLAGAAGCALVGVYLGTSGYAWRPWGEPMLIIQSPNSMACENMQRQVGHCHSYYGGCDPYCTSGVSARTVVQAIQTWKPYEDTA